MKKKSKGNTATHQGTPNPSKTFYDNSMRSPQDVEMIHPSGVNYLQEGHQRAMEIKAQRDWNNDTRHKLRNLGQYQGGQTFGLEKKP